MKKFRAALAILLITALCAVTTATAMGWGGYAVADGRAVTRAGSRDQSIEADPDSAEGEAPPDDADAADGEEGETDDGEEDSFWTKLGNWMTTTRIIIIVAIAVVLIIAIVVIVILRKGSKAAIPDKASAFAAAGADLGQNGQPDYQPNYQPNYQPDYQQDNGFRPVDSFAPTDAIPRGQVYPDNGGGYGQQNAYPDAGGYGQRDAYPDNGGGYGKQDAYPDAGGGYGQQDAYPQADGFAAADTVVPEDAYPPPASQPGGVRISLVGIGGQMDGRTYNVGTNDLLIGREANCAIRFAAETPGVSRRHCKLFWNNGVLMLMDTGSSNGTYLRNKGQLAANQPVALMSGDVFYVGEKKNAFELRFD